jgi:hypothetical protein
MEKVILNSYCEEVDTTMCDICVKRNVKLELKAINEAVECK